jgi:NAD(P)-dependent dehydrogenase (short-subunit alcohol dehydrogenase family)
VLNLKDQVAIISGGLGDIGRAIAVELARHGAHIGLGDVLAPDSATSFLKTLHDLGIRARYDRADVSDASQVKAWIDAVEKDLGAPTIAIPNAAIVAAAVSMQVDPQRFSQEMRVNCDGAFFVAQAAAQRMIEHKKPGRIVFIGSWAAHAAHIQIPAYCASKAAIRMLVKCLALELASQGIFVNEVAPGYVDAGLTGQFFRRVEGSRESARGRVPTGLLIGAEEVARNVSFLCDPENRQMTGTTILMDGGLSLVTPAKR